MRDRLVCHNHATQRRAGAKALQRRPLMRRVRATGAVCTGLLGVALPGIGVATGILGVTLPGNTVKADTATTNWTGAATTVWSNPANWSANVAPSSTVAAVFNSSYTNAPGFTASTDAAQGLWFNTGITQDFSHGGTNFTLNIAGTATLNGLTNTAILMSDSANHNVTVSRSTILNSSTIYMNQAGSLNLTTAFSIANGATVTIAGNNSAGIVNLGAALQSGTTSTLRINTAGTVNLSGSNSWSTVGATSLILDSGLLNISRNNSPGKGTFVINGGTLDLTNSNVNLSGSQGNSNALVWGGDWTYKGTNTFNTGTGNITLAGAGSTRSVSVTASFLTLGGVISNGATANSISKSGNGTLLLGGDNAFTGSLSVLGGALTVNNLGKVAAATGYNVAGGTFNVDNSTSATSSRLNSSATMSMQNGTFNLTGNAATASTDEAVGTLSLDSGANFITLTQATSTNISTRFTAGTLSRTNNAVAFIRGSGAIGQSGFGTSTTTQLRITNSPTADVIGGGGSFNSGTATNISIFPYLVADSSATGAVSGLVGYDPTNDSIRILKSGEYSSIASGTSTSNVKNSTTSQAVAVAAGTYNSMVLNQAASPGGTVTDTLGGTVILNSGVLLFTAAGTLRDTIVTGGQLQFAATDTPGVSRKEGNIINGNGKDVRLDTAITGSGGMTFSTFNSGANVSSVTLNNTSNSWTGTTTLNGLIKLGQAGVVPDASSVYVGKGGTLDMASFSEAIDGLTGVGNVDTTTSSATPTLTLGSNGGNGTFGGVIQNSGASSSLAVVKTGAGIQAFTNANTYSGGTNITGGTLLANNATNSTGAGSVIVQSTGTLGGTGKVNGSVTVQNNGNLLAGDGTATTLTLGSDLSMASGSTLKLALGAAGAHSTLARAGGTWSFDGNQNVFLVELTTLTGTETYDNVVTGLAADPGSLANWHITNSDVSGTFTYDGSGGIDLALAPVPEPGSLAAFGGIALALLRRRVRKDRNT